VVLSTLKEHNIQNAFKNCRSAEKSAYTWKGATSSMMVASKPEANVLTGRQYQSQKLWIPNCKY
jgi:hypothetical protein